MTGLPRKAESSMECPGVAEGEGRDYVDQAVSSRIDLPERKS
jgi:hypothetical protein